MNISQKVGNHAHLLCYRAILLDKKLILIFDIGEFSAHKQYITMRKILHFFQHNIQHAKNFFKKNHSRGKIL